MSLKGGYFTLRRCRRFTSFVLFLFLTFTDNNITFIRRLSKLKMANSLAGLGGYSFVWYSEYFLINFLQVFCAKYIYIYIYIYMHT